MVSPITDPQTQSSIPSASIGFVEDNAVSAQDDNTRILGRQIPSGNIRGNQIITGNLIINNPTTNTTSISLSGESEVMVISDPKTKIARIIIGQLPDGTFGMAISKPGIDVYTAFS